MDGSVKPKIRDQEYLTWEDSNPFDEISIPVSSRVKQVWAIGGGKGGVGKSLIASSLAISL